MGQRPIEVVDRRQQLERELRRPALLRGRRLLDRPPAVVLKLGPRPLRQLEVFIGLLRLRSESRATSSSSTTTASGSCASSSGGAVGASGRTSGEPSSAEAGREALPATGEDDSPEPKPGPGVFVFSHAITCPHLQLLRRQRPLPQRRHHSCQIHQSTIHHSTLTRPPPAVPAGTSPRTPCGTRTAAPRSWR